MLQEGSGKGQRFGNAYSVFGPLFLCIFQSGKNLTALWHYGDSNLKVWIARCQDFEKPCVKSKNKPKVDISSPGHAAQPKVTNVKISLNSPGVPVAPGTDRSKGAFFLEADYIILDFRSFL